MPPGPPTEIAEDQMDRQADEYPDRIGIGDADDEKRPLIKGASRWHVSGQQSQHKTEERNRQWSDQNGKSKAHEFST